MVFLKANADQLDPAECKRIMRRIGMLPAYNILTILSADFTGADLHRYITEDIPQRDIDRMRELILDKKYLDPVPSGLNPLQRFRVRWQRNSQRRWLYRYLPSSAPERVFGNIKHLVVKE